MKKKGKPKSKILNGKKLAALVLEKLCQEIKNRGLKLELAAVLVGNDPASRLFIRKKKQACKKINIGFKFYQFPAGISQKALENEIREIAENPKTSGMIIQLPLPAKILPSKTWAGEPRTIGVDSILNLVPFEKDIDCLGRESLKKFRQGKSLILPPVVGAIKKIFEDRRIKVKGKKVLVIGKGRLVGQPLIIWLPKQGAKVLAVDKFTEDLTSLCRQADIIISGAGKPGLINGKMIKKRAIIIDVGSVKKGNKVVGDVDFKSCIKKVGAITPVPGGIGPLTVACLLENLIKLNSQKNLRS